MIDVEDDRLTAEMFMLQDKLFAKSGERHARRCARWGLKPGVIVIPTTGRYVGKRCLVESLSTDHMFTAEDVPYVVVFVEAHDGTFSKSRVTLYGGYRLETERQDTRVPIEARKALAG